MLRKVFVSTSLSMLIALGAASFAPGCSGCGSKKNAAADAAPTKKHGLSSEQQAQVLLKVGNTTVTVGEFADQLAEQSPYLRARYNSPEKRREFLDNMVRFELLAAEASRRGLDRNDDVDRTRKQMMIQQLMKREFEDRIQITDVTDAQVQEYYNAHPEEFHKPEQVRASHIFMRNRAAAQRLLGEILAKKDDVNFFRTAAERNNEDPATRDRFGDLRFFSRPDQPRQEGDAEVSPAVATAAFALTQIGDIAPQLVEADGGFHIVKITGRRAAMNRTLEEASRPIRNRLWREKREAAITAFVAQLRTQANVTVNEEALNSLHINIPTGAEAEAAENALGGQPGMPGRPGPGMPMLPDMPHAPPGGGRDPHGH